MKRILIIIIYLTIGVILNSCATRVMSSSFREVEISQSNKYRIEASQQVSDLEITIFQETWRKMQKEEVQEVEHYRYKFGPLLVWGPLIIPFVPIMYYVTIRDAKRGDKDDVYKITPKEKIKILKPEDQLFTSSIAPNLSPKIIFKKNNGQEIIQEAAFSIRTGSYIFHIPIKDIISSIQKDENCIAEISFLDNNQQKSDVVLKKTIEYQSLISAYEKLVPPSLITSASFSDGSSIIPNNKIDALEESQIKVDIKNSGQGLASKVILKVESGDQQIRIGNYDQNIGDMRTDEIKSVTIPIIAEQGLSSGQSNIIITTKESNGYDAQPVKLVIPTEVLSAPKLTIVKVEMKDAGGLASGNGDGLAGTGETIELTAYVKNEGKGKAVNSTLKIESGSEGVDLLQATSHLGDIQANSTSTGKVVFRIPRAYGNEKINYKLLATDIRNIGNSEKIESTPVYLQNPQLVYKITGSNSFTNDGTNPLLLILENTGKLDANNVSLELSSTDPGLIIGTPITNLGRIISGGKTQNISIPLSFSRTYSNKNAKVTLKISQDDFSPVLENINLPVNISKPVISVTDAILDENANGKIEQGERIKLQLSLTNTGKLQADNVSVKIQAPSNIRFLSETSKFIGQVRSGATSDLWPVEFLVPGGTPAGPLPIQLLITEKDFSLPSDTLNYTIFTRGESVVLVKGSNENVGANYSNQKASSKPIVSISALNDKQVIYTLPLEVGGSATADNGIQYVSLKINGKQVYDSRNDLAAQDKLQKTQGKLLDFKSSLRQLNTGANDLEIAVFDKSNEFTVQNLSIMYSPEKQIVSGLNPSVDVDDVTKLEVNRKNPNLYAVIFGIEKYQKIPTANYASGDAIAFREYAIRVLGIEEGNIYFKINESATKSEFDKAFSAGGWLNKRVASNPNAEAIIFFSGHGAPDDISKEAFILPYDVDDDYLAQTATSLPVLYYNLSKMNFSHSTVFIDACFSGLSMRGTTVENIFAQQRGIRIVPKTPAIPDNMSVLTASRDDQSSTSFPEKGHGLFSYYLLKALSTKEADQDKNGTLTSGELYNYIVRNVESTSLKLNKSQSPTLNGDKLYGIIKK